MKRLRREDYNLIAKLYPKYDNKLIAERLGVSCITVSRAAKKLGVQKDKIFKKSEIKTFEDLIKWTILNKKSVMGWMSYKYHAIPQFEMEDILSNALIKLANSKTEYENRGNEKGILWSAIKQSVIDYVRRKKTPNFLSIDAKNEDGTDYSNLLYSSFSSEATLEARELEDYLERKLNCSNLSKFEKVVFDMLRAGYLQNEIAVVTNKPFSSVRQAAYNIRLKMA